MLGLKQNNRPKQKSSLGDEFDFFLLSLTNMNQFCCKRQEKCKNFPLDSLTVHGLWPSSSKGRGPTYCLTSKEIEAEGFGQLSARQKHEWKKHGTCSELSKQVYLLEEKRLGYLPVVSRLRALVEASQREGVVDIEALQEASHTPHSIAVKTTGSCALEELSLCFRRAENGASGVGDMMPCPEAVLRGSRNSGLSKHKCARVYVGKSCMDLTSAMKQVLQSTGENA
jgi:ribonuclease I